MSYLKRLESDLDRWIAEGWVSEDTRASILADAGTRHRGWSPAGALAILGSVLLAAAALSFVAANWADMPRLLRMGVILTALWAAHIGAGRAFDTGHTPIGHALALLAAALFGIAIFLTAQTFNMTSFRLTVLLIWSISALALAIMLGSRPVLILSAILGALWVSGETNNPAAPDIIWSYGLVWTAGAVTAIRLRSLVTLTVLAISLIIWVQHAIWIMLGSPANSGLETLAVGSLMGGAIAMTAAGLRDRSVFGMGVITGWAAVYALLCGWVLQIPFFEMSAESLDADPRAYALLCLLALGLLIAASTLRVLGKTLRLTSALAMIGAGVAVAVLPSIYAGAGESLMTRVIIVLAIYALSVSLILHGARLQRRFIGVLGILTFIAETLYIYAETLGGLLDTSLFFLLGGAILMGLSLAAVRWQKMARAPSTGESGGEGDAS